MRTAAEIIAEARYEDPSFTDSRHTDLVLRSRLADYQQELVSKVAEIVPEELALALDVAVPAAEEIEDGVELLDDEDDPLRFVRILQHAEAYPADGDPFEATVVGLQARFAQHRWAPMWVRAGRLFFGTTSGFDWGDVDSVRIYYVPAPLPDVTDTTELVLGDAARGAYVAHLTWRMAQRSAREVQRTPESFEAYWRHREQMLLRELMIRHSTKDRMKEIG
jgi:hypothetical protein